jgi:glutamine synthetase type III
LKEVGVFNEKELGAKFNILTSNYVQNKLVEGHTLEIIIKQNFLPRLISHLKDLAFLGPNSTVAKL